MEVAAKINIGLMPEVNAVDKKVTGSTQTEKEARLREACQGFEAIITRSLFATMRQSLGNDGILGKSFAKEMYDSMQDDIIATRISRNNPAGLAEVLYRQLSPTLSATAAPTPNVNEVA